MNPIAGALFWSFNVLFWTIPFVGNLFCLTKVDHPLTFAGAVFGVFFSGLFAVVSALAACFSFRDLTRKDNAR